MAGFNASSAVEPLDFDFKPFVTCKGTIPEPTPAQLRTFFEKLRKLTPTARDDETDKDLAERFDVEAMKKLDDGSLEAVVEICTHERTGKCPFTLDHLKALPIRPQRAFVRWLMRELSDPN